MKKFRVIRGQPNPYTGGMYSAGRTHVADSARVAVKLDNAETSKIFGDPGPLGIFSGATPLPIIRVYEMIEVPEADWR